MTMPGIDRYAGVYDDSVQIEPTCYMHNPTTMVYQTHQRLPPSQQFQHLQRPVFKQAQHPYLYQDRFQHQDTRYEQNDPYRAMHVSEEQRPFRVKPEAVSNESTKPVDNLLNIYLNQEGIDRGYSQLILKELHDATEMDDEQLNQAANEIINSSSA